MSESTAIRIGHHYIGERLLSIHCGHWLISQPNAGFRPIADVRRIADQHTMLPIPTLTTERLILRAPDASDFPAYRDFYAEPAASCFYGGPVDAAQAWRRLAQDIGHWALRGHGMWAVIERASRATVGGCGIVQPEGWPRHELSWWIVPAARRQGYAEEASRAAIHWAIAALGWSAVETHMKDENVAARALAVKLGGKVIARDIFPDNIARDVFAFEGTEFTEVH